MSNYLVLGIVVGSGYGLLAVSLIFVYQTTRVLNFAFGAFGMVGAYGFDTLHERMSPWPAALLTVVLAVVAGALLGVITLPVQRVSERAKAVASLAMLSGLAGLVALVWGTGTRSTPSLTDAVAFRVGDVAVTWQRVLTVGVVVVATAGIVVFFRRGRVGSALRAVADDGEISRLVGLPVRLLWTTAWAISTGLAVLVTIVLLPDLGLDPDSLTFTVLVPLAAVVVARFRSVGIGFATAFLLGLGQALFAGNVHLADYQRVLPLALIVVVLLASRRAPAYERV